MDPSTTGARVLLDELVRLGVREIVLCPGSRSAPLAYAAYDLEASGRLRMHVRVDERSAAFLALGLAKQTRRPAAVVTTSGTAVANLHPAVLEAHHCAVPLLLLTADRPPELRGVGANQATEQRGIFGDRVRLALELDTPSEPARQAASWRTSAARAYAAATGALSGSGTAGPVHLDLPYRDPLAPPAEVPPAPPPGTTPGPPADADRGHGTRPSAQEHLDPARTGDPLTGRPDGAPWVRPPAPPGVVAGGGPRLPHDPETLVVIGELPTAEHRATALAWARHHGAPVIAEPGPGTHELVLPHGAQLLTATDWVGRHLPRRLLIIGRPTLGRQIPALTREPGLRVEVVTSGEPGAGGWPDATHTAVAVHPFASLTLDDGEHATSPVTEGRPATSAAVEGEAGGPPVAGEEAATPFARVWLEAADRVGRALADPAPTGPDGPSVARAVHDALPSDAVLFLGSSSVARDVHLGVPRQRVDVAPVTSRGLAGIDGCVSTAVGLALARPDRPTVALLGDLTFQHDANGLLIGPDEPRPDLTLVVVDDDGGSIFGTLEYGEERLAGSLRRLFTTPTGTDIEALCAAHGVPCRTVSDTAELAGLVAQPPSGIQVVRVPVDGGERRTAAARARGVVAAALGGAGC